MRLTLRTTLLGAALGLVASLSLAAVSCTRAPSAADHRSEQKQRIGRGRYLVNALGCSDCHTPLRTTASGPEPDPERMLSGHPERLVVDGAPRLDDPWSWAGTRTNTAFGGPWGISYAPNLTPDQNSGLGIWTEDMFVRALRLGKHLGHGRPILPPMPWRAYAQLTDEDLSAIFVFLRSIPAIENHAPVSRPRE